MAVENAGVAAFVAGDLIAALPIVGNRGESGLVHVVVVVLTDITKTLDAVYLSHEPVSDSTSKSSLTIFGCKVLPLCQGSTILKESLR